MSPKIKIKDPFSISGALFFKVPLSFQAHQHSLTQSEKDVYIALIAQVYYRKTLSIEIPVDTISYWTGIKSIVTITNAIRGLSKSGWISNIIYQKQKPNIYVLSLEPKINTELLEKLDQRTKNTSKAKKKSIAKGESGKFIKGNNKSE